MFCLCFTPLLRSTNLGFNCKKRKVSGSLRRKSNSSLGVLKKEISFDGSTYLTPTQRKNQEIKQIRLELAKANQLLDMKDKEIAALRSEVTIIRGSGKMNDSSTAETGHRLENIDFELMETALKEEEETRNKLEAGNEELKDELIDVRRVLAFTKDKYEDETPELQKIHEDELYELRKESNKKVEELVNELTESSLRCARQQYTIEQKNNRLDDILRELTIHKENQIKDKIQQRDKACQTVEPNNPCEANDADYRENIEEAEAIAMYPKDVEENKIHYTYQLLKRSIHCFKTDEGNSAQQLKSIEILLEKRKQKLLQKLGVGEGG